MKKRSNLIGGNTNFKTSLVLSAIVLIILFLVILSQILKLKSSGDVIIENLNETKNINKLLSNLILIEEKFDDKKLTIHFLDSIKSENQLILNDLKKKRTELGDYVKNQTDFYEMMEFSLSDQNGNISVQFLKPLSKRTKQIKKELLTLYSKEVEASTQKFERDNSFFSTIFIVSTLIGFVIIGLAILKILEAQRIIHEKSSILDSILENTNDIANFYEPIFDESKKIIDFKITYASKTNVSLTDLPYENIIGQRVTVVYPYLKSSMLFNQLVSAYKNQQYFEKTIEAPINNSIHYYNARYIPVKGGLQVIITDLSSLFSKQEELEKTNNELFLTNKLFHEAEEVANLASFIWYFNRDMSLMSDNIYRILGHTPQSFKMSAAKFREFTHPDDLEKYDQAITNAVNNNTAIEFTFRVLTKDNEVKHLFAKGHHGERNGENIMVGVVQDVSERIKNETQLEAQNLELIRQNAELDSFNRVASHDLQEPLRKIQMFISRINDENDNKLTNRSYTYFEKIESAATRMRKLINNLLAFSRIDNKAYEFETVDLKETFEHVLDTLSESAIETEIEFNSDNFPKIHAIAFLMEQLFTNLLSNAIKYKSNTRSNKIIITYQKILASEAKHDFKALNVYYHQFVIKDNGIGFDQKESKKVFNLFHRLHTKSEYAGTGLGLAICKKIVTKHRGFIFANAVANQGATFTVYLPANKLAI